MSRANSPRYSSMEASATAVASVSPSPKVRVRCRPCSAGTPTLPVAPARTDRGQAAAARHPPATEDAGGESDEDGCPQGNHPEEHLDDPQWDQPAPPARRDSGPAPGHSPSHTGNHDAFRS